MLKRIIVMLSLGVAVVALTLGLDVASQKKEKTALAGGWQFYFPVFRNETGRKIAKKG